MSLVSETKLPYGHVPLMMYNGEVCLQTASGKVVPLTPESHSIVETEKQIADMHNDDLSDGIDRCLTLRR